MRFPTRREFDDATTVSGGERRQLRRRSATADNGRVRKLFCIAIALTSGCSDDSRNFVDATVDSVPFPDGTSLVCDLFTRAGCMIGEKCTWLVDAVAPEYVGHFGCAPNGTANVGDACMYGPAGAMGYDNCKSALVCGDFEGGPGACKQICDSRHPCAAQQTCMTYPRLFSTGDTTPPAAGVCEP